MKPTMAPESCSRLSPRSSAPAEPLSPVRKEAANPLSLPLSIAEVGQLVAALDDRIKGVALNREPANSAPAHPWAPLTMMDENVICRMSSKGSVPTAASELSTHSPAGRAPYQPSRSGTDTREPHQVVAVVPHADHGIEQPVR